jgi:uncharacterized protein YukE
VNWSDGDPGQGDPDGIDALAGLLGEVSAAASGAQSSLQKLKDNASDAIWRGSAADAFRGRIDKLPGHLQQLAQSYADARDGFRTYSATVRDLQQRQRVIERDISAANAEHAAATQGQTQYASTTAATASAAAGGPAGVNPYDAAVVAAKSRLSAATSKLHGLADDRRSADGKVKGSLKDAHNDGMKNKSGWTHFWESVSKVLAVIAIVLIVIAVIAVIIAFPEALLAFAAADGLLASLAAGGAVLGEAAAGGALGMAMTGVGVASLGTEGVLYSEGEGSLSHLGLDAALTLGPFAILKGARYLSDASFALRGGEELTTAGRAAEGWSGEGLNLSRSDSTAVDAFMAKSAAAEPGLTSDVQGIADEIPGAKTEGLDFRLKGEDSLKRKVAADMLDNGTSADQALGGIKDSIRYTVSVPAKNYETGAQQAVDALKAKGYEPVSFKNSWDSPGYKGINSTWRDPASGQTFEVQFHTPDSFDAKMSTHDLYEEQRLPSTDPLRKIELDLEQAKIFAKVPVPPGAGNVSVGG